MKNLSLFLEGSRRRLPDSRVRFEHQKARYEPDSWDVSLVVSAFDRKEQEKAKPEPSGAPPEEGK